MATAPQWGQSTATAAAAVVVNHRRSLGVVACGATSASLSCWADRGAQSSASPSSVMPYGRVRTFHVEPGLRKNGSEYDNMGVVETECNKTRQYTYSTTSRKIR